MTRVQSPSRLTGTRPIPTFLAFPGGPEHPRRAPPGLESPPDVAKKKTTAKKTKAKASTGTSAARKPSRKKTTSKKATVTKKRTTATKKAASTKKKATTRKKTVARKPSTAKKKVAAEKKPAKKKPPSVKKPSKKAKTSSTKKAAAAKQAAESAGTPGRKGYASSSSSSIADARKAALKLAAAAGLRPVESSDEQLHTDGAQTKRLTKSPLNKRELTKFRELLLIKRAAIVGNVSSMESEALTGGGSGSLSHLPQHMADAGSDTYDQSLSLDIAASQRKLLQEIDDALQRIDDNTYGICELLGIPISKARLEAKPWAKYSIEAARRLELGRASP